MEGERKCSVSLKKNVERVYGMPIKDVLIEYYIKKDMSMYELAEELNVAVGTVFNWLKENGIAKVKLD